MATLRAGGPLKVGDVTLVPIERTAIRSEVSELWCWIGAFKEPFAIVVCDADGIRGLAADSSDVALDALMEKTPNLRAVLSNLSSG